MKKIVQIENVALVFDTKLGKFTALREINLDIVQGEFVSLIGHSGCGKSTLLNLIAGLTKPTAGVMLCDGREIAGPGPERAVVFQNHSLLPWMTCFDNIYLAVESVFGAKEGKAKLKQRTLEALEPVSYTHLDVYKRQETADVETWHLYLRPDLSHWHARHVALLSLIHI